MILYDRWYLHNSDWNVCKSRQMGVKMRNKHKTLIILVMALCLIILPYNQVHGAQLSVPEPTITYTDSLNEIQSYKKGDQWKVVVDSDLDSGVERSIRLIYVSGNGVEKQFLCSYDEKKERYVGSIPLTPDMQGDTYQLKSAAWYAVGYENTIHEMGIANITQDVVIVQLAEQEDVLIEELDIDSIDTQVRVGQHFELTTTVTPEDASNQEIVYSSSNSKILSITPNGVMGAKKEGKAVITVASSDGSLVTGSRSFTVTKELVIVLDPGHGGNDPGAVNKGKGMKEAQMNQEISKASRTELLKYEGVNVHITQLYAPGRSVMSMSQRALIAKSKKADVLVSQHINSGSTTAKGSEVWVTVNKSALKYNSQMRSLAYSILGYLNDYGFANRGVKERRSENGSKYSNGSIADYYGIIRNCVRLSVPAMIVEHGFIGSSDAYLMDTNQELRQIGIADAQGIAEFYGLTYRD